MESFSVMVMGGSDIDFTMEAKGGCASFYFHTRAFPIDQGAWQ
jgi:hypothetical protein